jgi:excisionase family DNA binding protein
LFFAHGGGLVVSELMTVTEAAEMFAVKRSTLLRWIRELPTFPRPLRLTGRTMRLVREDVQKFLERRHAG